MKFDIAALSKAIQTACPQAVFALLHGSAKDGEVKEGSDIDIALYIDGAPTFEILRNAMDAVYELGAQAKPDIGILNNAEPVYRFEALKGKLLFGRDRAKYAEFFSRTCREYECQIADYQRQHNYRLAKRSIQETVS